MPFPFYCERAPCRFRESGAAIPDEGIEDAFEVLGEMPDIVSTACWVGDCFLYTNVSNRYLYGGGGCGVVP